ncbi:MAG: hypothetical protein EOO38_19780 [Cytophagaceae bacterium]|nr:MAG: hypothetical protein EOO38_19780 [Cytophagaceae bacterium]
MDLLRSRFRWTVLAALVLPVSLGGGCAAHTQKLPGEPQAGVAAPRSAPIPTAAAALLPTPAAEPEEDEPEREARPNVVGILSRAYQLHGRGDYAASNALFQVRPPEANDLRRPP